jgi:hypothetical protein
MRFEVTFSHRLLSSFRTPGCVRPTPALVQMANGYLKIQILTSKIETNFRDSM